MYPATGWFVTLEVNIVSQNHKMVIARVLAILALWIFVFSPVGASGQGDRAIPNKVVVAVAEVPPFAMKAKDGRWEGLSIELWKAIAQKLGVEFELREYSPDQLVEAVTKGEVDVIPALAATEQHEMIMDLSLPFLRSGSAIAVATNPTEHSWLHFAGRLVSLNLLPVIGLLILLSLTAGTIVWRQSAEELGWANGCAHLDVRLGYPDCRLHGRHHYVVHGW
jgi:polar amino acid transport system substrate-binding protein